MVVFPLHTILRLLGNESKVHLFQAILFQEMLPTRVKSHLARFRTLLHIWPGFRPSASLVILDYLLRVGPYHASKPASGDR